MTTSIPDPGTRSHLVRALRTLAVRRPRRALLEEAEVELWRTYRSEQVDLLFEAARLRARTPDTTTASRSDVSASRSDVSASRSDVSASRSDVSASRSDTKASRSDTRALQHDLDVWREQAIECVSACACDGYPIAPRLAECLVLSLPNWTAARDLAGEARRLRAGGDTEA